MRFCFVGPMLSIITDMPVGLGTRCSHTIITALQIQYRFLNASPFPRLLSAQLSSHLTRLVTDYLEQVQPAVSKSRGPDSRVLGPATTASTQH